MNADTNLRDQWYWCVPDRVAAAWGAPVEGVFSSHSEHLYGLSDVQLLRCVTRMCQRNPRSYLGSGREAERISNPATLSALAQLGAKHPCPRRMLLLSSHLPEDAFTSGDYVPDAPRRPEYLVGHLLEAGLEPCLAAPAFTALVVQEWSHLSRRLRYRLLDAACTILEYGADLSRGTSPRHALQLKLYENIDLILQREASSRLARRRIQTRLIHGILPALTTPGLILEDARLRTIANTLARAGGKRVRKQRLPYSLHKHLPEHLKAQCTRGPTSTWSETYLSANAGMDVEAARANREYIEGWRELLLHSRESIPDFLRVPTLTGSDIATPLVTRCLETHLGDDVFAWNVAAELLPTWAGDFAELVDVTKAVAGEVEQP